MKLKTRLIITTFLTLKVFAGDFILNPQIFSDFFNANRIIEPTSPILGPYLVKDLKDSKRHPHTDYKEILEKNNDIINDLHRSTYAYVKTLKPGLREYCAKKNFKASYSNLTMVEHAAIPNEFLFPLRYTYMENVQESYQFDNITELSKREASHYQEMKYDCGPVNRLKAIEFKLERACNGLDFCINARKLNSILSSAEAAYPRLQYSINGYTKYVYNELFKEEKLEDLLFDLYETEKKWIEDFDKGVAGDNFIPHVVDTLSKKYHVKSVFLALAYSKRNMPSLDTEYAKNPKKALLLEVYFWHFKDIRNKLSRSKYVSSSFSYDVERSPGFYHFLTAALLGCEARLAGHGHITALMLGLFSKLGYKADKFFKALDHEKYKKEGFSYVRSLLKKQGFYRGVETGYEAGIYGSQVCGKYMRGLKRSHKSELKQLKKVFKKEVQLIKEKYKPWKDEINFQYALKRNEIRRKVRDLERGNELYAFVKQKERLMKRAARKNFFNQMNEINDLINNEIRALNYKDRKDSLKKEQEKDIRAVDLSRAYTENSN